MPSWIIDNHSKSTDGPDGATPHALTVDNPATVLLIRCLTGEIERDATHASALYPTALLTYVLAGQQTTIAMYPGSGVIVLGDTFEVSSENAFAFLTGDYSPPPVSDTLNWAIDNMQCTADGVMVAVTMLYDCPGQPRAFTVSYNAGEILPAPDYNHATGAFPNIAVKWGRAAVPNSANLGGPGNHFELDVPTDKVWLETENAWARGRGLLTF